MMGKLAIVWVILLLCIGCGSLQEKAVQEVPKGNILLLDCSLNRAMEAAKASLLEMGFTTHIEENEKTLKARKATSSGKTTSLIELEIGFFEAPDNQTRLVASACETITKSSTHLKKYWLLFVPIPYGTYHTEAKIKESTITDPEFYQAIFEKIKNNLEIYK